MQNKQTKDPVCGMEIKDKSPQHSAQYDGKKYSFCSSTCKNEFESDPEKYSKQQAA